MNSTLEEIVSLCKRRGFAFPSAEIYGGFKSAYDLGPLGTELIRNIKNCWWNSVVRAHQEIVGIDCAILSPPQIWKASGHLDNFNDPLVDCKKCKERFRKDQIVDKCPNCGSLDLTEVREFNLMFETYSGPVKDEAAKTYLRPETAQGMFVNFLNVMKSMRLSLPFGIAQTGRSFRNEISPGNFIFRTREFEQMELEYFVHPQDDDKYFKYWLNERYLWYVNLGIKESELRVRYHKKEELAHYSKQTADIEFCFPWGWGELEGIANRGDYDLRAHSKASGRDLSYFDPFENKNITPHVIEPAAGASRAMLSFLISALDEDIINGEKRLVLRLNPRLAPYQVAVLPLLRKEPLISKAKELADLLRTKYFIDLDQTQSIGKRYRRHDEIGTPFCVTVDFETLEDNQVTIRDRDTTEQIRVPIQNLINALAEKLGIN